MSDGHDHDEHAGHDHGESGTHDHHDHDLDALTAAVFTVSSSRTLAEDAAGDAVAAAFEREGHAVRRREVVPDEFETVREAVEEAVADGSIDVVVTTGGTGVTPDDVTVEAVAILFDKELPGFGELFRSLSREEVGTRIVGTRAIAGIVRRPDGGDGVPVFCLPGSENAARLGTEEIVVAEAPHLAGLARR